MHIVLDTFLEIGIGPFKVDTSLVKYNEGKNKTVDMNMKKYAHNMRVDLNICSTMQSIDYAVRRGTRIKSERARLTETTEVYY